ncbi:hypothetical protein C1646_765335 [Rhizophagus diaphanus]|nr:hypothetical protein C1646_765335 [Rhizophagus diaphanus] [Rhizophagus sp. MUCL 43196]
MSDNRRGCGKHFYADNPLTYRRQTGQNNKASHANICFRKWFNRDKKEIFSNRLDIKYSTSYHAKGYRYIFNKKSKRHMYVKRLDNFRISYSDKAATKKKQEIRSNRACRRIFKKNHSSMATTDRKCLKRATNNRFLFSRPQHIDKSIMHLKYRRKPKCINKNHYSFPVPFFSFKQPLPAVRTLTNDIHSIDLEYYPIATPQKCEKWFKHSEPLDITSIKDELYPLPPLMDPVADPSLIPHDIRPYIPDGPIYIEEQVRRRRKIQIERTYVVPGLALWIKYIRDNIKNGLLPRREFQITPASTSQSTPSNSAVPSLTKRRRPTIKKIKRHDAIVNANKACEDSNSNHPSPYPPDSNASNTELDEQVNTIPTTPVHNSTHIIQLPSPSNTNDSLAEDLSSKYFF